MSNELYFIPILERACRAHDRQAAFREAFRQIETLGQQDDFAQGYRQFLQFMQAAREADAKRRQFLESERSVDMAELLADVIDGEIAGSDEVEAALELLKSDAECWSEYHRTVDEPTPEQLAYGFRLEKDGSAITPPGWTGKLFGGLEPGHYVLQTDLGRVLWRGDLSETALNIDDNNLRMAASSEKARPVITRRAVLSDEGVDLIIMAGPGGGAIQLVKHDQDVIQ